MFFIVYLKCSLGFPKDISHLMWSKQNLLLASLKFSANCYHSNLYQVSLLHCSCLCLELAQLLLPGAAFVLVLFSATCALCLDLVMTGFRWASGCRRNCLFLATYFSLNFLHIITNLTSAIGLRPSSIGGSESCVIPEPRGKAGFGSWLT